MPITIILTEDYTTPHGVKKLAGTEMIFSNHSEEAKKILERQGGEEKLPIPADLPGRNHFVKAGFDSLQSLGVLEEWTDVKGVGAKTAEELDNYFTNNIKNKGE